MLLLSLRDTSTDTPLDELVLEEAQELAIQGGNITPPQPVTVGGLVGQGVSVRRDGRVQGRVVTAFVADDLLFTMSGFAPQANWNQAAFEAVLESVAFLPVQARPTITPTPTPRPTTGPTPTTPPTITPTPQTDTDVLLALGRADNSLGVLTGQGWLSPRLGGELQGCPRGNVFIDRQGKLWAACFDLLVSRDGGATWEVQNYQQPRFFTPVTTVLDLQNNIWLLGREAYVVLNARTGERFTTHTAEDNTYEGGFPADAVAFLPDDVAWFGGFNLQGSVLVSYDGESWIGYGDAEMMGLPGAPRELFAGAEGQLLLSTGVDMFVVQPIEDDDPLPEVTLAPFAPGGEPLQQVRDVLLHPDGSQWYATLSGIVTWDGTTRQQIGRAEGLPSNTVYDLTIDEAERVWAATNYGIAVQNDAGGWDTAHPATSDLPDSSVRALAVRGAPDLPAAEGITQTTTISGQLTLGGQPLAGTTVELCSEVGIVFNNFAQTPCENNPFSQTVQTADDGSFTFAEVPLGSYHIAVYDPTGDDGEGLWVYPLLASPISALEPGDPVRLGTVEINPP
jgi:hypothetical protein